MNKISVEKRSSLKIIICFIYLFYFQSGWTQSPGEGLKDIDGNFYPTVIIGSQEWMSVNLKTSKYSNGDSIYNIIDNSTWENATEGAYSQYNNSSETPEEYGFLYNFYAVGDTRKLCPNGWRVPSDADWDSLRFRLGGGSFGPGGKIKEAGFGHWNSPNTGATNETGFTALPGGSRENGVFDDLGNFGYYWSTWQDHPSTRHRWELRHTQSILAPINTSRDDGYSCRCMKDYTPSEGSGVFDVDGNFYPSVIIGEQEWMALNLRTTKYANGEGILNLTDSADWDGTLEGAYSVYNNDLSTPTEYGFLYNFYAVDDERELCPSGWAIPSDADWDSLRSHLGGGSFGPGGKIKEAGFGHWNSPNTGATNETGFSALPGGSRENGVFDNLGDYGYYWSTWQDHPSTRHRWELRHTQSILAPFNISNDDGYSCRCLKKNIVTHIEENKATVSFSLFPNPAQNNLNLKFEIPTSYFVGSLSILGINGTERFVSQINSSSKNVNLDVTDLENGVYFIILTDVEGKNIVQRKFIKQD